jgi:hypothetical protein
VLREIAKVDAADLHSAAFRELHARHGDGKIDEPVRHRDGAGDDPALLVEQYATGAQRTLRMMASDLAAKAHKIVWQRYASTSPGRVILAIADRCVAAASLNNSERHKQLTVEPSRRSLAICP